MNWVVIYVFVSVSMAIFNVSNKTFQNYLY